MDAKIIFGAESFFLRGGEKAVILIHGFTGSPAEMRLLGEHLNKEGFTVLGIRLTGHGTSAEDLEHTLATDWMRSVVDAYDLLRASYDSISVCGLSMGGLLSILLDEMRHLKAVVSIAAPVFLREEKRLRLLPPKEEAFGKFLPRPRKSRPDLAPIYNICYTRMPFRSVHELLVVMDEGKKALFKMQAPLLVVQGRKDHTVRTESAEYIYGNSTSEKKEIFWLEETGHRATIDVERELLFQKVTEFLKRSSE